MTCPLHENCCSAAPPGLTVIVSNNRQQTANPIACAMTSLQSGRYNLGPNVPLLGGSRAAALFGSASAARLKLLKQFFVFGGVGQRVLVERVQEGRTRVG